MATLSFVKQKPPSDMATDVDLDLTPMMSMFLILLPFLVSMAVLTHLTTLEFSLPPTIGQSMADNRNPEKPKLKLTVVIAPDYLLATHGEEMLDSLPASNHGYDFDTMRSLIAGYKQKFDTGNEIVVASNDQVVLSDVVALMDNCKAAGYEKIGLSSATVNPQEAK
jgi:biopolymer transport protein ExbD